MPLTFKSQATGNLVMVQAHARALLHVLGKAAEGPGILLPDDMPAALATLMALPDQQSPQAAPPADEADAQPPVEAPFPDEAVSLRKRAWPLIRMIEQAMHESKPIVWGT